MSALAAIGAVTGLTALTAAVSAAGGGPNWIGISSTIAAVSGLIATITVSIVQLVRLFRRPPDEDEIAKAVEEGLRRAKRRDRRAP